MNLTFVFPPEVRLATKAGDVINIDDRMAFEVVLIHRDGRVDVKPIDHADRPAGA